MSDNKKKIGIMTFHAADNFGAIIQSFALKMALKEMGYNVEIVNYCPSYLCNRDKPIYFSIWRKNPCYWLVRDKYIANKPVIEQINRRISRMKLFRKEVLDIHEKKAKRPLGINGKKYDCIVYGSDQIWNPELLFGVRPEYFGEFPRKAPKNIAYAASLGDFQPSGAYSTEILRLISTMDAVSIREDRLLEYVRQAKSDAICVCDPVYLIDSKKYEEIAIEPSCHGYVLYLETSEMPEMRECAKKIATEKGLELLELRYWMDKRAFKSVDYSAGPREFLGYIINADYVVSNSFHVISLSIILKKKFAAFNYRNKAGARILSVLDLLGLRDRMASENSNFDIDEPINFTHVEEKQEHIREISKKYLQVNI